MREASLLRRGLSHLQRRGQQQLSGAGKAKTVQEFDEEMYGGLKSAKMLFTEQPTHKTLIGRWDWHVVHFLLAMIPPGMMLLLVQWARYDMKKMEQRRDQKALIKESERLSTVMKHQQEAAGQPDAPGQPAAAAGEPGAGSAGSQDVQQRLSRLEQLILQLQAQQAAAAGAVHARDGQPGKQQQQQPAAAQAPQSQEQQAGGSSPERLGQAQQYQPLQKQQQQQEASPQQEEVLDSLQHRLAAAWRWAGSSLAAGVHRPQAAGSAASAADATGASSTSGSSSGVAGGLASAAVQPNSSSSSLSGAAGPKQQHTANMPAPAVAGQGAAATAGGRAVPGNTANRLLHALGLPLRWLRQQADRPQGS